MSQNNQDNDQNFVLGLVTIIVLAILIGAVTLGIVNSNSSPSPAQTTTKSEVSHPIVLGNFDFALENGKITLSGDVVDEKAKLSLITPAKLLWGENNVVDQLNIKPDAPRFWWNVKPFDVLSKLKAVPDFKLKLSDNIISGNATVGSEGIKDQLLAGFKNWFSSNAKSDVTVNVNTALDQDQVDPKTLLNLPIEYATGASEVPEIIKPLLLQIAQILKDDPRSIVINGHTDNTGVAQDNKVLSLARAEKIKAYLVSQGVDTSRLNTAGFGDEKPVADNNSDAGKAKNRRIEFSNP
jgi:OOP family OmpA-OmpF porin